MGEVLQLNGARKASRKKDPPRENRQAVDRWLNFVDGLRRKKTISHTDESVAQAATKYPSATWEGVIWPAQRSHAVKAGVCPRAVSRAFNRLKSAGAIDVQQRGNGRSARYILCIDGAPIIAGSASHDRATLASHKRAKLSGSASHDRAMESSYLSESIYNESSPPSPPTSSPRLGEEPTDDRSAARSDDQTGLDGELLGPEGEPTFDQFWDAISHDDPGKRGPALAAWRQLSTEDRLAVGRLIGPKGLDLDGVWACTWLRERGWTSTHRTRRQRIADAAEDAVRNARHVPRGVFVIAGTAEWRAWVEHKKRTTGVDWTLTTEHEARRGWWFPTQSPPIGDTR